MISTYFACFLMKIASYWNFIVGRPTIFVDCGMHSCEWISPGKFIAFVINSGANVRKKRSSLKCKEYFTCILSCIKAGLARLMIEKVIMVVKTSVSSRSMSRIKGITNVLDYFGFGLKKYKRNILYILDINFFWLNIILHKGYFGT